MNPLILVGGGALVFYGLSKLFKKDEKPATYALGEVGPKPTPYALGEVGPKPIPIPKPRPSIEPGPTPGPTPPPKPSPLRVEPITPASSRWGNANTTTATRVRARPTETSDTVTLLPERAPVEIQIGALSPPTAAAPKGWLAIKTFSGIRGYVAAHLLSTYGTAKERGMTEAEARAYHARKAERPRRTYT